MDPSSLPKYVFAEKNTFLEVTLEEDSMVLPRRSSWSCGDHERPRLMCELEREEVAYAKHRNGTCNPCVFFASKLGCRTASCEYCHLQHTTSRPRPRKEQRDGYKLLVAQLFENGLAEDPTMLQQAAMVDPYMRQLITGRLDAMSGHGPRQVGAQPADNAVFCCHRQALPAASPSPGRRD
ncbi:unnamed protein product [Durusdinium trenchii]|uniref:Uncharacterized protein n=2 Tax=Durusdinium trenchii TaxID=1381693 RepID=A0ABP0H7C2_9DINO